MAILPYSGVFAQNQKPISYQGRILDDAGIPVSDGQHTLTIGIWNAETGGDIQFLEPKNVEFTNGFFNVYIGDMSPFTNVTWADELWLEVQYEDNGPYPRIKLSAVPYSYYTLKAENALKADSALTVTDGVITQEKLAEGVQAVPWGDAGGSLMGTYPNPVIHPDSIVAAIGPGSITQDKLAANITAIPIGEARGDLVGFYPEPSIRPGIIKTEYFSLECVTAEVLGPESVETEKIHENAVTLDKMAHTTQIGQVIFWDTLATAIGPSGTQKP